MENTRLRASPPHIKAVYARLFSPSTTLTKLLDAAVDDELLPVVDGDYEMTSGMVPGRSLAWKLFLMPPAPLTSSFPPTPSPLLLSLHEARKRYVELLKRELRAPDGSYEDYVEIPGFDTSSVLGQPSGDNWSRNNPLSLDEDSGWHDWFNAVDLRKTIRQDVERTFPDIPYFRDPHVQSQLTIILYLQASQNPQVGYRQGMHELLAPLLCAIDFDSLDSSLGSSSSDLTLADICDRTWVSADAYALFCIIMNGVGEWYEWREPPSRPGPIVGQANATPYVAPIVIACNLIHANFLKNVDPNLWNALQESQIEPQIYGIRWLRLLFTREFAIADAMKLWDGLFAIDSTLQISKWVCVSMLLRIRNQLISSDYSGQLGHLLRYPTNQASASGSTSPISLLLQQARVLQSSPTPSTGASVVIQNRQVLGIPVEVPEPSSTGRLYQNRGSGQNPNTTRLSTKNRSTHSPPGGWPGTQDSRERDSKKELGFPEILSKGLSEFNDVVSSTVSEIRRSLPELASHPRASPSPVTNQHQNIISVTGERPPWEPRTRFETEREIHEYAALNKKLGAAMGWALDVLLPSGSDRAGDALMTDEPHDESELSRREALQCLAYVRDILNSGKVPQVLDQDRFLKAPEARKRRSAPEAEEQVKEKEKERAGQDNGVQRRTVTSSATHASSAPLSSHIIPSPPSSVTAPPPAPPTISPPTPYLYLRNSTPVSSLSRTPYVSPSNLSSAAPRGNSHSSAPIAPWHSTPSAFGAPNASASLQRPPPISNPSNVQSDDSQRINPTPTYHSDPLRG